MRRSQPRQQPARRDDTSMIGPQPRPAAVGETIEFGRFRVLPRRRQLLASGAPIELGTRAFDLLLVLLEAAGSLVGKDELLSRVWPNQIVEETNLQAQIAALRKALGEDRALIRTERRRGYRFTGVVRATATADVRHRSIRQRQQSGGRPHLRTGVRQCSDARIAERNDLREIVAFRTAACLGPGAGYGLGFSSQGRDAASFRAASATTASSAAP
jgi:DNA-binding winged helix-turn-helix (wHTH) protein